MGWNWALVTIETLRLGGGGGEGGRYALKTRSETHQGSMGEIFECWQTKSRQVTIKINIKKILKRGVGVQK